MGKDNFIKIPNGLPGMEHRLSILYTHGVLKGRLSLMRMVDVWATSPAKFYGLYRGKVASWWGPTLILLFSIQPMLGE